MKLFLGISWCLMVFLLQVVGVSAQLSCQYTAVEWSDYSVTKFYFVNGGESDKNEPLEFSDFTTASCGEYASMKVRNPSPFNVEAVLAYSGNGTDNAVASTRIKIPAASTNITYLQCVGETNCACTIDASSIRYHFEEPWYAEPKTVKIRTNTTVCRSCPSGETCINDGNPCLYDNQCGGLHCVQGFCSNTASCFENDCHCEVGEVQCPNNSLCVERGSVRLGEKTVCGLSEECVSAYVNESSGICEKSSFQIEDETRRSEIEKLTIIQKGRSLNLLLAIALVVVALSGAGLIYFLWSRKIDVQIRALQRKSEELESREKAVKELESTSESYKKKLLKLKTDLSDYSLKEKEFNDKINHLNSQIVEASKLKETNEKTAEEKKTLIKKLKARRDGLREEKESLASDIIVAKEQKVAAEKELNSILIKAEQEQEKLNEIQEALNKNVDTLSQRDAEITKPRRSVIQNHIIEWLNPQEKYYPCFYEGKLKNKPIHRWVAENQIYNHHSSWFNKRYPGLTFGDLIVHHIDHDFKNYHHKNLAIISWREHNAVNHSKLPVGNWEEGIKELKKLGIRQPHIGEIS